MFLKFRAFGWRFREEIFDIPPRLWLLSLIKAVVLLVLAIFVFINFASRLDSDLTKKFDVIHYLFPPLYELLPIAAFGLPVSLILFLIFFLREPSKIPYFIDHFAFWLFIRAIVMVMTTQELPEGSPEPSEFIKQVLAFKRDLFFSGHTGFPLLIWYLTKLSPGKHKRLGKIALIWSVIQGFCVVTTRLHYSIDIFGAVVFTDWSFRAGKKIFRFERTILRKLSDYQKTRAEKKQTI